MIVRLHCRQVSVLVTRSINKTNPFLAGIRKKIPVKCSAKYLSGKSSYYNKISLYAYRAINI
jgi:hypothetical protein